MKLQKGPRGSYKTDTDPGEPSTGQPRLSVTEDEAKVLAVLAAHKTVLEIGTGLAVSTKALASTAFYVTTFDIDEWVIDTVFPQLTGIRTIANLDLVSTDKFELIFIDAAHETDAVTKDIQSALTMIRKDGCIVLHDYKLDPVKKAVFQLGITPVVIDTEHGLAMVFP